MVAAGGLVPPSVSAAPAFVQGNFAVPQTPQSTITVGYSAAQTAGNLNVVIVGWNDTTHVVSSVTDTRGNTYQLAVGPTRLSPQSQSIYYAKNIAGSTNSVTVSFNGATPFADVRILEYSGLDATNPFDAATGASGSGTTSSSGAITTTSASELLVAANTVASSTTGAGSGFTNRILTSPDGDIAEDRIVSSTGSYSATAPITSGIWVMQIAAFRASGTVSPTVKYIQGNFGVPQTPQTSVTVAYPAAQTAGNLNVVIVGWNDTSHVVSSVTDTRGNTYQRAVGPTAQSPVIDPPLNPLISQSIYYAKNIAGGSSNSVTVKFSGATIFPDIRVLEYGGIDPNNPVDVAVGSAGNTGNSSAGIPQSKSSASGTVLTTNVSDLLVAANTVEASTNGPGSGFTQRLLTNPDGDIAEDRVVAATGFYSASAPVARGGWVVQMVAFRSATALPPDTSPPTVSITGVSGTTTLTVTVSASDSGTGVAAVRLQVDGVPYGTAVTASPYTFSLNTAKFAGGSHTLTATAWDFANNVGNSIPVSVTFTSSGNPALTGLWSGTVPLPIVAINSVLLPNSKILMWDGQSYGSTAIVWNTTTNSIDSVPVPADVFCSGVEQMADGRILEVGGHDGNAHLGLPVANVFDPSNESWTVLPNMSFSRWYPTATMLADGRIIVTSGETNCNECDAPIQEIYNPSTNKWSQLSSAPLVFPYYPHVYQLPDGRVLVPASTEAPIESEVLDLNALTWTVVGGTTAQDGGSSAMYLPSKFLKMGTSVDPDNAPVPSFPTAYVLDMTQTNPLWRQVDSMKFARTYHNATLLPDGNVLVTGGGPTTNAIDTANAILPAELWSPTTETWTTLAPMTAPRLYHSEALLLPDGRVLISGGGRYNDDTEVTDQFSAEFFSPPYLFKGPRPTISTAPSQLPYGQNFSVITPDAARIAKVSLIRFGSVTHDINMSQRFIPLSFSVGTGSLTVTGPVNANLAPPGNYMLFLVDTNGIPSVAAIVHF